jgi:hypothetical protein
MIYLAAALRNSRHGEDLYKTTTAGGLRHRSTPLRGGKAMSAYTDITLELAISGVFLQKKSAHWGAKH